MKARKNLSDLFVEYPPVPLLQAYAYANIIGSRLERENSRADVVTKEALKKQQTILRHNVRIIEHDLAFWATRIHLSFKGMLDIQTMQGVFDEYANQSFPKTEEALGNLEMFIYSILNISEKCLEHEQMTLQMAQVLKNMAATYHRKCLPSGYTLPQQWRISSLQWYITLFPQEVLRLPIIAAIRMARLARGVYWNPRMEKMYGASIEKLYEPSPKEKDDSSHNQLEDPSFPADWGEPWTDTIKSDWEDTLKRDDEDREDWMNI